MGSKPSRNRSHAPQQPSSVDTANTETAVAEGDEGDPRVAAHPLIYAIESNRVADVQQLLTDYEVNLAGRTTDDEHGITLLHAAVYFDAGDVVRLLLARGAPANAVDGRGMSALHVAVARDCCDETVHALLRGGHDINATDPRGATAFHLALALQRRRLAGVLLLYRPNVNTRTVDGRSVLHTAVATSSDSLWGSLLIDALLRSQRRVVLPAASLSDGAVSPADAADATTTVTVGTLPTTVPQSLQELVSSAAAAAACGTAVVGSSSCWTALLPPSDVPAAETNGPEHHAAENTTRARRQFRAASATASRQSGGPTIDTSMLRVVVGTTSSSAGGAARASSSPSPPPPTTLRLHEVLALCGECGARFGCCRCAVSPAACFLPRGKWHCPELEPPPVPSPSALSAHAAVSATPLSACGYSTEGGAFRGAVAYCLLHFQANGLLEDLIA